MNSYVWICELALLFVLPKEASLSVLHRNVSEHTEIVKVLYSTGELMAANAASEDLHVQLLNKWRLGKYIKVVEEKDWDEVEIWKHLTDDIMTSELGFSTGAVHKFNFNYKKWCDENTEEDDSKEDGVRVSGEQPEYHMFPYLHGNWDDARATYGAPASWTKNKDGLVILHGVIQMRTGYHNELVTTLPKEAHPTRFIYANRIDSRGAAVTINVYCNGSSYGKCGEIKVRGGPNSTGKYMGTSGTFISLNGICWYASKD